MFGYSEDQIAQFGLTFGVGATGENGNLYRLERSLHEPLVYTLSEFRGNEESEILNKETFESSAKDSAVKAFAKALGFTV